YLNQRDQAYPRLHKVSVGLIPLKELEEELQEKLNENGELRSDASPQLQSIRKRINKRRSDLRTTINRVMARVAKQGRASDEGPTIRNGRMAISVLSENTHNVMGYVHAVS